MDPELLAELFDQHAAALVLYARQWGENAEDVVQEAFLKLSEQTEPPEQVRPWLYRVVRNMGISWERQKQRRRKREATVSPQQWFEFVDDRLEIQEATAALQCLSDVCREAVVARLWGGLTFEQLAELQDCSLATAHRRYNDSLRELQTRLERCTNTKAPC